jgi:hypothetical protein
MIMQSSLRELGAALLVVLSAPASQAQSPELAITNTTVVRVADGALIPDQTIVIRGNRIAEVGSSRTTRFAKSATVVDGRGAFVIPGLWDMHVHAIRTTDVAAQSRIFGLFVANGVTGVRDMGSVFDTLLAVRPRILRGDFGIAPRMVVAGPLLDGPRFRWSQRQSWHVVTADEARRAVDSLANARVDFLKPYSTLPREAYFAVVDQARRRGLRFGGHIPATVTALEASNAGQSSFEHNGMNVYDGCVDDAATRISSALGRWTREGYSAWYAERRSFHAARDSVRCASLLRTFRDNGTWMVPTVVNELKDSRALKRAAFAYLDSASRAACQGTVDMIAAVPDTLRLGFYDDFRREIAGLHASGLGILAGTDMPNPCLVAGFSLHDEIEELAAAGLSNRDALAAATINPARYLNATDSLGSIAAGMLADLVVLDANPLIDLANLRRIRAVVTDGRLLRRPTLDSLLARP